MPLSPTCLVTLFVTSAEHEQTCPYSFCESIQFSAGNKEAENILPETQTPPSFSCVYMVKLYETLPLWSLKTEEERGCGSCQCLPSDFTDLSPLSPLKASSPRQQVRRLCRGRRVVMEMGKGVVEAAFSAAAASFQPEVLALTPLVLSAECVPLAGCWCLLASSSTSWRALAFKESERTNFQLLAIRFYCSHEEISTSREERRGAVINEDGVSQQPAIKRRSRLCLW